MPGRIAITGTGRTGTTLLIQVLTELGADTGFSADAPIDEEARAGLESDIFDPEGPRFVKNPILCTRLAHVLERGVQIDHLVIPMRRLEIAAASRIRASELGRSPGKAGGLFHARDPLDQAQGLQRIFYDLIAAATEHDLPLTLVWFPRWALDPGYAFRKLGFLVPGSTLADWRSAITRRADPAMIHEEPLTESERAYLAEPKEDRTPRGGGIWEKLAEGEGEGEGDS